MEIKQVFSSTYEEIRNRIENNMSIFDEKYEKLTETVSKQGQKLHKEIESFLLKTKNEINENKVKHQFMLEKHLEDIKRIESQSQESLSTLKELRFSNIVSVVI